MNILSILLLISIFFTVKSYSQIFVSAAGSDSNPGTFEEPFATIPAAVTKAEPGDTIYVRGGTYTLTSTITISKGGNADNMYYLIAYENEKTLLDFSSMDVASSSRGIRLSGDYWHIKGLDIKGAGDNGMNISGSNNIIEFCSFYENRDTGLQLGGGASNNQIINCDSYFNADPSNGNADGFAPKLDVGTNNYFYGCRAWQNSDDGWDGYLRGVDDVNTIVENCWCFANGYLKNGNASSGNGNGYKMGGGDDGNALNLAHDFTLIQCLAFNNRVKGFDQNNNRGSMTLYNCSAYMNGTNYSIPSVINSDETATVINSAALENYGSLSAAVVQQTNSWLSPFNVTAGDFISIDTMGVRGERKADGSLPDVYFFHLAEGSDLIDAGTDIGLPYAGTAPDLGAFEKDLIVPVELISFSASVSPDFVMLSWSTATEHNNYGFGIQKSIQNEFKTIGFTKGTGNSAVESKYNFKDNNAFPGINSYRLKQVDFNGTFNYSRELQINFNYPEAFELSQNYPNPFNPVTNFEFRLPACLVSDESERAGKGISSASGGGLVSLKVFDLLGNEIAVLVNEKKEPGVYRIRFNGDKLSSGIYIYVLQQGKNTISKKMILIK